MQQDNDAIPRNGEQRSAETATASLRAAFTQVDVTPQPGLRLAGMPDAPRAVGTHRRLHARVAMFDDGEHRAAIVTLDAVGLEASTVGRMRVALGAAGGIDPGTILISCSHTHRAPHTAPEIDVDRDDDYLDFVQERLVAATVQAVSLLRPVELRIARTHVPGWGFNRRPMYRGGEVGTHGPEWVEDFTGPEGVPDDELTVLLALAPDGGEPVGGLVNYACHPTVVSSDPVYSPDFVGPLTETCAARYGVVFAFLQGASGDVAPRNMAAPGGGRVGIEHAEKMGQALAEAACLALDSARTVVSPRIRVTAEVLDIEQRRPTMEQVRLARWYLEEAEDVDEADFTRRIYGHDYTFYTNDPQIQTWFARETIGMWEWQRRSGMRVPADQVEVQVIAIGDIAFVGYPGEMFAEFGLRTKELSPFATTVVCELSNGWHGYIPTRAAFERGGYEPRLAFTSRLAPDAGDRMTDTALRLLARLDSA